MRRALADIFAVVCLVLFLLCAFMWVRSFAVADRIQHQDSSGFEGTISSRGSLAFFSYDWSAFQPKVEEGWSIQSGGTIDIAEVERSKAAHHRGFIGFSFFRDSKLPHAPGHTMPGWCLVLPYWFFTLLFSLIPIGRLLRMSKRRKPE